MAQSLRILVARNALFGAGGRLVTLAVGLVITPYLLFRLGPERFGIWTLVSVVTGFIGFADFSFKSSFVKFLAETLSLDNRSATASIVSTGLLLYVAFAVVVFAAALPGMGLLVDVLKIPEALAAEAKQVFLIGTGGYLIALVFSVFPSICDAKQRMDVTNSLGVGALIVSTALTIAAVESGFGLHGVAWAQFFGILLFHISCIFAARSLAGPIELGFRRIDPFWLRRMFSFSIKLHISSICVVVNRQLDKFLLSRWAGLNFVSSYEIALRLAGNVGTLQPYLAGALLPASSSLSASGENARLREAYRKATKYLFLVGIPPFVFLLFHGSAVIRVWLGTPRSDAAAILVILATGHMVNSLSNAMAFVCQGIGKPGIQTAQSLFQLLTNVVLSIALFRLLGPLGAPMGTTIAFIAGALFFALMFHRHIDISTWTLLREAALIPLLGSVVAALPLKLYPIWNLTESRLLEITGFLIAGIFFCVIYGVFCQLTGYVGRNEWKELKNVLSSLKGGGRA